MAQQNDVTAELFIPADMLIKYASVFFIVSAGVFLVAISFIMVRAFSSEGAKQKLTEFLLEHAGGSGKPSISRLQMFIWNSVIAFSFLYILAHSSTKEGLNIEALKSALEAVFSWPVLALLGISNGTYYLGKRAKQGSEGGKNSTDVDTAVDKISDTKAAQEDGSQIRPDAPVG